MILKARHGQSLMELLIGMAVGVIFIVGAASIIIPSLQVNKQAGSKQAQGQIAQDMAADIRAWSANNWNSVLALATGTANGYYLNTSISPFTAMSAVNNTATVIFTSNGTWTKPANLISATVQVVGGGGGGGGSGGNTAGGGGGSSAFGTYVIAPGGGGGGSDSGCVGGAGGNTTGGQGANGFCGGSAGSGGGGGAYAATTYLAANLPSSVSVYVGLGASGGVGGSGYYNGGTATSNGGAGGGGSTGAGAANAANATAAGGTGGAVGSSTITGATGSTNAGAGGAAGGSIGGAGGAGGSVGTAGGFPGGGGGGASGSGASSGGNGEVIVTETLTPAAMPTGQPVSTCTNNVTAFTTTTVTFTSSGTWTAPANLDHVIVQAIGGGGGGGGNYNGSGGAGGGSSAFGSYVVAPGGGGGGSWSGCTGGSGGGASGGQGGNGDCGGSAGGGGGGGAYAASTISAGSLSSTVAVVVGLGGGNGTAPAGGTGYFNGGNGSGNGGGGGAGSMAAGAPGSGNTGGAGGSGGAVGSSTAVGANGGAAGGAGGAAGGTIGGAGGAAGIAGTFPGGGGGGNTGAAGANGEVIVTDYSSPSSGTQACTTYNRYFYLSDIYRDASGNATTTASGNFYDPSTKLATIVITQASSTATPSYYSFYITRASNNAFSQGTWLGGAQGASSTNTFVSSTYGASKQVTVNLSGALQLSTANGAGGSCFTTENSSQLLNWPINEGSGITVYDTAGNGYNTTWMGLPASGGSYYASGTVGTYAGYFDGYDDYLQVPSAMAGAISGSFTLSGWINMSSCNNWSRILDLGNGASASNVLIAATNGTSCRPEFDLRNGGTVILSMEAPSAVPLNTWTLVTAVVSSTNATLYINGSAVANGTLSAALTTATRNFSYIGRSDWSSDGWYAGSIDDVRIYNTALSATNVASIYAGSPTSAGLVAEYNFENNSSDSSGNGNTATWGGTPVANGIYYASGTLYTYAGLFNGANDYLQTPNLTTINSPVAPFTINFWFNPSAQGDLVTETGGTGVNAGWHDSWIEVLSSGQMKFRVWNCAALSPGSVSMNSWNMATLMYDGSSTLKAFLNGSAASSTETCTRTNPGGSGYGEYFNLGATDGQNMGSGQWYNGRIGPFVVYARTLSSDEINTLYLGGTIQ